MAYADYYPREPQLPWSDNEGERRFRKITRISLIVSIVLGLIIPFIPVPEIDRDQYDEIPPRLVQVIQDRQKPPPPPPPKPKAEPKPKAKPKAKPKPKPKAKPKPKPKPQPKADAARQRAMQAMTWADELEDLREFDVAAAQGDLARPAATPATPADNGILTARAGSASAGIDTGALGQPTEDTRLRDRQAAAVESTIPQHRQRPSGSGRAASRTDEEIQLVFDRYKGAIDRIYNRALRRDPTLQGKIVFKLTIAPSGQVTKISIVSSEMNNPALERRLMSRIKLFNFGAKQVGTVTVTYPVVFLPS